MKYSGSFRPPQAGCLSKAGVAGMKRGLCRVGAAVAVIGCIGASTAVADTVILPDPMLGGLLMGLGQSQSAGPGTHTLSVTSALASGSATVVDQGLPFPSVLASVQAQSLPGATGSLSAFAELDYDIEIIGPAGDVSVDVSGLAMGSGSGSGFVGIGLTINNVGFLPHHHFDLNLTLPTNSPLSCNWIQTPLYPLQSQVFPPSAPTSIPIFPST